MLWICWEHRPRESFRKKPFFLGNRWSSSLDGLVDRALRAWIRVHPRCQLCSDYTLPRLLFLHMLAPVPSLYSPYSYTGHFFPSCLGSIPCNSHRHLRKYKNNMSTRNKTLLWTPIIIWTNLSRSSHSGFFKTNISIFQSHLWHRDFKWTKKFSLSFIIKNTNSERLLFWGKAGSVSYCIYFPTFIESDIHLVLSQWLLSTTYVVALARIISR